MPELNYSKLNSYLNGKKPPPFYPVYMIYGEESLYKTAFNTLLDSIIPVSKRSLNYDPMDDDGQNINGIIERVKTFSLQPGPKVVALFDSKIFYAKQDEAKLLDKAKEAFDKNDFKKAAAFFASLLARQNLTFDDIGKQDEKIELKPERAGDRQWIEKLCNYCIENGFSIPAYDDNAAALEKAVENGFPKGNHLIITTDMVDKRRSLFKTILEKGFVIDCSVPKGARREDKLAQEAVLIEKMKTILSKTGKTINKDAFHAASEMTGFDLRAFAHNMENLANYVGDRKNITVEDVDAVLQRSKKDPMYEITNAVADKNLPQALSVLESLLSENIHALQILGAISNQVRRLIMAKGFLESSHGSAWYPDIPFGRFKNTVLPEIQAYDKLLLDQLYAWENLFDPGSGTEEHAGKKKKRKTSTDLLIARNPQSPYPVFQTLRKSEAYAKEELLNALEQLARTDIQLKTTGQNPKLIMEAAIFCICTKSKGKAPKREF